MPERSSAGRAPVLYRVVEGSIPSVPIVIQTEARAMPIYKRCSRCGKRIPSGSTCLCVKQRHREYDRYSRDQRSRHFYNSKEWESGRTAALEVDDGIDVYMFMTEGIVIAADMVHHIVPLKDDWDKRIDIDNMMSLSSDTHSMIEQMYKKNKAEMIRKLQEMLKEYRGRREDGGI